MPRISSLRLLCYSMLGVPLAFAGLPIYVHIPHYYATVHHVPLVHISAVLLGIRFIDALQDPLIGMFSDRWQHCRRRIMALSCIVLCASFVALFYVPTGISPALWMAAMLLLVYSTFSTVMINFYAAGLPLGRNPTEHTRISAYREGMLLLGVILAAALPHYFTQHYEALTAYHYFALCIIPVMAFSAYASLRVIGNGESVRSHKPHWRASFALLGDAATRRILLLFFVNSIPTAITSTLFLFFTEDVLGAPDEAGILLITYFLSAACSVALWAKLAAKFGRLITLRIAMMLAIGSFIWAYGLQAGDVEAFYIICVLSGVALGADLTILPSLFADALKNNAQGGAGFSLWNFLSKLNLSLAAGVILPLLAWQGYDPNITASETQAVSIAYALIPCAFKLVALWLTWRLHPKEDTS